MRHAARVEAALRALAALLALVAAGALLWRPPVPEEEIAPAGLAAPARLAGPPAAADPAAAEAVVRGNIFSASRAAPRTRYSPAGPDGDAGADPLADGGAVEPPAPEPAGSVDPADPVSAGAAPDGAAAGDAVPRLYGTMVGPDGAAALMRLDPARPGARLYREGDRAGTYRVIRIEEWSVVLAGPGGRIVLRLNRPRGPTP